MNENIEINDIYYKDDIFYNTKLTKENIFNFYKFLNKLLEYEKPINSILLYNLILIDKLNKIYNDIYEFINKKEFVKYNNSINLYNINKKLINKEIRKIKILSFNNE